MLAVLEPDIAMSWEVTGVTIDHSEQGPSYPAANSLHVFWKDPLVLGKQIICEPETLVL